MRESTCRIIQWPRRNFWRFFPGPPPAASDDLSHKHKEQELEKETGGAHEESARLAATSMLVTSLMGPMHCNPTTPSVASVPQPRD